MNANQAPKGPTRLCGGEAGGSCKKLMSSALKEKTQRKLSRQRAKRITPTASRFGERTISDCFAISRSIVTEN